MLVIVEDMRTGLQKEGSYLVPIVSLKAGKEESRRVPGGV
jgi:hypothetical protein